MEQPIFTNHSTYKVIAEDAYAQMMKSSEAARTLKSDGTGWIIKYDPDQVSFKSAMVVVVFTGMWLEALMHLLIVHKHGEATYRKYDRNCYEEKLRLLGVDDKVLLENVKRFRFTRKELVHEKAFFDQTTMKTAQQEAKIAHELMSSIDNFFSKTNPGGVSP